MSNVQMDINPNIGLITELKFLAAKYPNDMDFGKAARKLVTDYKISVKKDDIKITQKKD